MWYEEGGILSQMEETPESCVLVWVLPRPCEHWGKKGVNEQVPALVSGGVILLGVSERL